MEGGKSKKRPLSQCSDDGAEGNTVYRFQILLPDGRVTDVKLRDPGEGMHVTEFVRLVRRKLRKRSDAVWESQREIRWDNDVYLEDMNSKRFTKVLRFCHFEPKKCNIFQLYDGAGSSANTFQNMWDLTPQTDLLAELPAEYTFETALADLIDNALQAVWVNGAGKRKLISVTIEERKISIFDSGPGMDDTEDNSIVKWGRMGSSNHRLWRKSGTGGRPPYLMPVFGMFGYGGPIASMHLGRRAVVSSKTVTAKKVYTLHLEREILLKKSGCCWKTDGGVRDPLDKEIEISPHGSFTMVEIQEPRFHCPETFYLQCKLKDIYFPYVQCDEAEQSRTTTPIEFLVNDTNLTEIENGEVAVTNLHSCHGPQFVLQLTFSVLNENDTSKIEGNSSFWKANARLRCVYFPIMEGKESIDRILEKLESDGCGIHADFENFPRVSVRRLGRLLPEARWQRLPFMEAKLRKGDKAHLLKRCCARVKCFVETDAGFSPTLSKTDLAHQDAFTNALKNFGNKYSRKNPEIKTDIFKDGKILSLLQLEKEYQDWVFRMHDEYDEELNCGEDEPVLVVSPSNKRKLGITSDVVRVHKIVRRRGNVWKSGQKVKLIKGSVPGAKNNLYMTLEYILLEGFQGDAGGEARLICRPIDCPDGKGCLLSLIDGRATLDIRESLSFPISTIDSQKCIAIDDGQWHLQVEKKHQKALLSIDLLCFKEASQLGVYGELPVGSSISSGYQPPEEIVAVVRPASFSSSCSNEGLDQKHIVKVDLEMLMSVMYTCGETNRSNPEVICSERERPSSRNGFHGLYIFSLGCKFSGLFHRAGIYTFLFATASKDQKFKQLQVKVSVEPDFAMGKWIIYFDQDNTANKTPLVFRVGECIPPVHVTCIDGYSNLIAFSSIPDIFVQVTLGDTQIVVKGNKVGLSTDGKMLQITEMLFETGKLDMIRPSYEGFLEISSQNKKFYAKAPCQVLPGALHIVKIHNAPEQLLLPNTVISELILEMFDAYGNHLQGGVELNLKADGLCFLDRSISNSKVGDDGCIRLCGLLKVTASYGTSANLSVYVGEKMVFKKAFEIVTRKLRAVTVIPEFCFVGSNLENVTFEIVDSSGIVDENIHGQYHTLSITSGQSTADNALQYTFCKGKCIVPIVSVPKEEGTFHYVAYHTQYPELQTTMLICATTAPKLEPIKWQGPESGTFMPEVCHGTDLSLIDPISSTPTKAAALLHAIIDDAKRLDEETHHVVELIKSLEMNIQKLADERFSVAQKIRKMQAELEPQALCQMENSVKTKRQIVTSIEQDNSAASIICRLSKAVIIEEPVLHFMQDVVGLVVLLGTVESGRLSSMLARCLGEDLVLAIVCRSYYGARVLEIYNENGEVDKTSILCKEAAAMGMGVPKQFNVICLEDIRPYIGKIDDARSQRLLNLPDPRLPSGQTPQGFLGYAVNMITIDIYHLHTRTRAGFGLRETLFYRLFGELQVYETRNDMQKAKSCIRYGAISLDGGIIGENGVMLLGSRNPKVQFPVLASEGRSQFSMHTINILQVIEEKKNELAGIDAKILKEEEALLKSRNKFAKKSGKLHQFLESKKHLCMFSASDH